MGLPGNTIVLYSKAYEVNRYVTFLSKEAPPRVIEQSHEFTLDQKLVPWGLFPEMIGQLM